MIFDTHCHGYWRGLGDRREEVRRNMLAAGVVRSIQIGADYASSLQALELARDWGEHTWCTAGIHPTDCQECAPGSIPGWMEKLEETARGNRDKVVGIGETGLDYYHLVPGKEEEGKRVQREFFAAQAELARSLDLALVIHTRDAAADMLALMRTLPIGRAVIHCYSQDPAFARTLMALPGEIYFSFSGVLTYKNARLVQQTARELPLDRILLETDAPFLPPQAVRNRVSVNEPAFTRHILDFLQTLRDEPTGEVEQAVWDNSNRAFRIPA
ncbi:MAG: TatD family hydrolase [Acidobacteriota bacterium]|jgi:TatD DNase family protein|nr:TatD family hydrolase [Acidobacteriota bacterium]